MFRVLEWNDGAVRFLDQTLLPDAEEYITATEETVLADAIRRLAVRGAPLIGIAAAYGVALAAFDQLRRDPSSVRARAHAACNLFASTRPTAVNLFRALSRQRNILAASTLIVPDRLAETLLREARAIHQEDAKMCDRMADLGVQLFTSPVAILTHCNTGALATGGRGTALGVSARAWELGLLTHLYMDETRPLLQGMRLTAWEVRRLGIPGTLIHDSAAGDLMRRGRIQAVLVGADRIAANGDTANKIGTYGLAVLAHHHRIPFYVVAPVSTIDPDRNDGNAIPIEERDPEEVTIIRGTRMAPEGTPAWAPAFDVTPAELITAIVTDRGVAPPPYVESLRPIMADDRRVS